MKKAFWGGFTILLFIISACSKEAQQESVYYSDNPLFFLSGTMNGLPINIEAGHDAYQLYTGTTWNDSVFHIQSIMAVDSPNFKNAFFLDIRGAGLLGQASASQAYQAIQTGPLPLADPSGHTHLPHHYDFVFYSDSVNGHIPLRWEVPGASYYGDSCTVVGVDASEDPNFQVVMKSAGPLSCTPEVKHIIQVEGNCKAELHLITSTANKIEAQLRARVGIIEKVDWFLNGEKVHTGPNLNHNLINYNPGYRLRAEVSFKSGCAEIIEKVVLAGVSHCDINLDFRKSPHRQYNPHNLSTAEIRYYDAAGKEYTSFYQNPEGAFRIESLGSYWEQEVEHKRISFSGRVLLRSADGNTILLDNFLGSVAVPMP